MADQPTSPTPPAEQPDASAQQRIDLALRLLAAPYRCDYEQLRLTTGALPSDLPFELPLPDGARILGALSLGQSDQPDHRPPLAIILVETPHTVEQGAQRLSAALEARGWMQSAPLLHMRGGFVHVMPGYNFMRYGSAASDDILTITTLPSASAQPTTFSISVQRESPQSQRRPRDYREQRESIPALFPPTGATQQGGGGGGGGSNSRLYATATLSTDHTTSEVMANYDRQLEGDGWRRRSGGSSGSIGWSYWAFTDDEGKAWRGSLAVFGDPDRPRDYLAFIQIELDSADESGFTGWQSHSILRS